jgi:hypothetical protein
LEAAPGFEPGIKVLQTSALPLGYAALSIPVEVKAYYKIKKNKIKESLKTIC